MLTETVRAGGGDETCEEHESNLFGLVRRAYRTKGWVKLEERGVSTDDFESLIERIKKREEVSALRY